MQYAERYIQNLPMTKLGPKAEYRKEIHTKILQYARRDCCLHCSCTNDLYTECFQCNKKLCTMCTKQELTSTILCVLCSYENNLNSV